MKKITHKTRIKVSRKLNKELGIGYWNVNQMRILMISKFEMELTSKRMGLFYFRPYCEHKLLLFTIQHSEYIINK
jgi:hypothetical protein